VGAVRPDPARDPPGSSAQAPGRTGTALVLADFRQLLGTLRASRAYPQTLLFLAAYLLYNDGIQTVIILTAVYARKE
jgi:UMF1 family MFS transporter